MSDAAILRAAREYGQAKAAFLSQLGCHGDDLPHLRDIYKAKKRALLAAAGSLAGVELKAGEGA